MIEELKEKCFSFDELLESLALEGYQIKSGKNIRIKPYGKQKFVTMKVLGDDYSEEKLKEFFYCKRSNDRTLIFNSYKLKVQDSELLRIQDILASTSKDSIILSMNGIDNNGNYPKYYNARYRELKRYNQIVETINFLNDNEIFSYEDLQNKINSFKEDIVVKEVEYEMQKSDNETLQLRVPLCELYLKYLDDYECYIEQKDIEVNVEPSDEVKAFIELQKELQVNTTDDVKDIISTANRTKMETNRQYAYLTYLKNKVNELEKVRGASIENQKGYIKSISFSKRMIDEARSNEKEYCVRIPYSEFFFYIPKDNVAWMSYDNRAVAYLIDDKEYELYDKNNQVVERIRGEQLAEVEKAEKQKINELYKNKE
jgi:hypothetical protein